MAPRKGKGKAKALPKEPVIFTIHGDIVQETEEAILVDCGAEKPVWLPKSQIEYEGERDDIDVAIRIPDWLAEQEGLHDGQRKASPQPAPESDGGTSTEPAAEAEAPAPQPCRFKAEVTGIADGAFTILVIAGDESREFTFAKDLLRFDGDDVVDLQVGYTGIEFLLAWHLAVESGLADFLGMAEPTTDTPAHEGPQPEPVPVAAEAAEDDAPKAKPYKQKLRTETVKAYVELTPDEKVGYAQDLSEAMELRMDHKETAANYSRLSREADKEAYKIKAILDAGREEREIDCDVVGDFNTGELVYVESEWPHREIQRRPMTSKDRQLLLPMDQPKQPEPETAAAQPTEPEAPQAKPKPEEPETVTLYGEILEQHENETVFRVHYGDGASTVAEFTIPNDQIQAPAFGDPNSTEDMITLTRAYALEAEIIAAPEEESPVAEEGVDFDAMTEADPGESDPAATDGPPEDTADPEEEKGCSACARRDVDGDISCAECGDDLLNFAPLTAAAPQGQPESAGAVQ